MSRNSHTHELFYRTVNNDGTTTLTRFAAHVYQDADARRDLISLAEGVAISLNRSRAISYCCLRIEKGSKTLNRKRDGIVYKVDGKCEFFVSRYFYLWPSGSGFEDNNNETATTATK